MGLSFSNFRQVCRSSTYEPDLSGLVEFQAMHFSKGFPWRSKSCRFRTRIIRPSTVQWIANIDYKGAMFQDKDDFGASPGLKPRAYNYESCLQALSGHMTLTICWSATHSYSLNHATPLYADHGHSRIDKREGLTAAWSIITRNRC